MTTLASGFVCSWVTSHDNGGIAACGTAVYQALGSSGRLAAHNADGVTFLDGFCHSQEYGDRAKRLASEIHVEPSQDYSDSSTRKIYR